MAINDINPYTPSLTQQGSGTFKVTANSNGSSGSQGNILPGEPVTKVAGAAGVLAAVTNGPTTTNRIVGIATAQSTETASVDGTVEVYEVKQSDRFLIAPKVAATWNTQAKYNALCGARVLIDNTSGVYTILAADGASNGCVIQYLDISRYPGLVAFSFNTIVNYANV